MDQTKQLNSYVELLQRAEATTSRREAKWLINLAEKIRNNADAGNQDCA